MINSHEDANLYYNKINGLIDEYLENNKIRPSNLKRYLQNGSERFKNFLKRNNLSEVGCERILQDVIEDRYALEADKILKFERFNIMESEEFKILSIKECIYKAVPPASLTHEKILADAFDTSLGHINSIDSPKHIYNIENFGKNKIKAVIFLSGEIDIIKNNIQEYAWETLNKSSVKITIGISIQLGNLVSRDSFDKSIEQSVNKESTIDVIKEILGMKLHVNNEKCIVLTEENGPVM